MRRQNGLHIILPTVGPVGEVPAQEEAILALGTCRQRIDHAKRGGVAGAVGRWLFIPQIGQQAVVGQVIPELLQIIPPCAAHPGTLGGDLRVGCGKRQFTIARRIGAKPCRAQQQATQIAGIVNLITIAAQGYTRHLAETIERHPTNRVEQRTDDRQLHRHAADIAHPVAEDGARQPRIFRIKRHEWGKGFQRYSQRQLAVFEVDRGIWVGAT